MSMPPLHEDETNNDTCSNSGLSKGVDYYNSGSSEIATETKLTLSRLETVSSVLCCSLSTSKEDRFRGFLEIHSTV